MNIVDLYKTNETLSKLVNGYSVKPIHRANDRGFGWHIMQNPTGTFSFSGTIPKDGVFATIEEALNDAFAWLAENKEHASDISTEIFADFIDFLNNGN